MLWSPSTNSFAKTSELLTNKVVRRTVRFSVGFIGSELTDTKIVAVQVLLYFSSHWCGRKWSYVHPQ